MSYATYTLNRILSSIFVLFLASIVIFSILRLIPGDPAVTMLGEDASQAAINAVRERLGLHLPIYQQYLLWISDILTLNMGESIMTGRPIQDLLFVRFPRSFALAVFSIAIALIIALPMGLTAAINRNTSRDYGALLFTQVGISFPNFVFGIFLILIFGGILAIFPTSGYVSPFESVPGFLSHVFLPSLTMGVINAAIITRFVRSEMLEQLNSDYVRTARAYGHPKKRIIRKYTLKNALIPTLTVVGIQFGGLLGGLVVIEQVFSYPGMGLLILDSLYARDYPLLQIGLLVIAGTFIAVNLVVDLIYGYLNPKIKY